MVDEGFPFGSLVALDLEDGAPFSWPRTDYVKAWIAAVDARDFTRLFGMRLEPTLIGTLVEPWTAPFHIMAGAPDFRLAGLVSVIWIIGGAAVWRAAADRRARRPGSIRTRVFRSAATGLAAGLVVVLWIAAVAVLRVPRWCLP